MFLEEKKNISHTHPLQALNFHFEVSNDFFFSLCAYSLYDVKSDTVCACMFSKLRRKCVQHKLSAHMHTHTLCVHSET